MFERIADVAVTAGIIVPLAFIRVEPAAVIFPRDLLVIERVADAADLDGWGDVERTRRTAGIRRAIRVEERKDIAVLVSQAGRSVRIEGRVDVDRRVEMVGIAVG